MDIIRQWRSTHGHSQARLAKAIEVHPTAVSKIENRENSIALETFYRLVRYTGLDPMELLEDIFESVGRSSRLDNVTDIRAAQRKRARPKRIDA